MLVWTLKPSTESCALLQIGEKNYTEYKKSGLNLQGMCDDKLRFTFVEIVHPASTSEYLSWALTNLRTDLEHNHRELMLDGTTIVADNAYVKKPYMSVPIKGKVSGFPDSYNYHLSQLRIRIECAFGVLVHRWAILRTPMGFDTVKIPELVMCL